MELDFNNKIAVVTGGSRGIGLATAAVLAEEGARVIVGARSETEELSKLRTDFPVTFVAVDLARSHAADELINAATESYGGVDILINNVGASESAASVTDFTDEQWQRIFDITLFSAVRVVRSALPAMAGRDGAAIVTVSSLNAKLPMGMIAPYSAAKAALTNFTKSVAETVGPDIRVNTVSPGPIRTQMWTAPGAFAEVLAEQACTTIDDVVDRIVPESMKITSGRFGESREVAELVAFLASPRAAYITGADYVIDGGMYKSVA